MTSEEFEKLCKEFKAQGLTDEDLLAVIVKMFDDGKIEREDMEKLAATLGFELTEEFKAENPTEDEQDGITKEEIEDAKIAGIEGEDDEESEDDEEDEDFDEEDDEESENEDDDEDDEDWRKNFY